MKSIFNFGGRMNRQTFSTIVAMIFIANSVVKYLVFMPLLRANLRATLAGDYTVGHDTGQLLLFAGIVVVSFVSLYALAWAMVKRSHDIGYSASMALTICILHVVVQNIALDQSAVLTGWVLIASCLYLCFARGGAKKNAYGDPPKAGFEWPTK